MTVKDHVMLGQTVATGLSHAARHDYGLWKILMKVVS